MSRISPLGIPSAIARAGDRERPAALRRRRESLRRESGRTGRLLAARRHRVPLDVRGAPLSGIHLLLYYSFSLLSYFFLCFIVLVFLYSLVHSLK